MMHTLPEATAPEYGDIFGVGSHLERIVLGLRVGQS